MWEVQKMEVLNAARRMHETGLVVGTTGNVSQRFTEPGGRQLAAITPSGRHYDTMRIEDIVLVDMEGHRIEGELLPSIETMLHLGIYRARRNVCGIVHTHATYGSIVAVTGNGIPPLMDDQVTFLGGEIKVAEYAPPGSVELAKNALAALGPKNAVVLSNHGALTVGRTLREAFNHCELLEKTAKIYVLAMRLGEIRTLPPQALEAQITAFTAMFADR